MFIPAALIDRARANVRRFDWAAKVHRRIVDDAAPWLAMSDEQLWSLMFGPTITRSWMVWSNGHCPACRQGVPMFNWQIEALEHPWKVRCPHCRELFPKNDFHAFYRTGLDNRGVFDPRKADRSLLFNAEHPDPNDPLHSFGVDDGEGYVTPGDGDMRWRFIGAYLIYGQWKQLVLKGIATLAAAFVLDGNPLCAQKAGILLHRVADLYPGFDHKTQAWVYETTRTEGFVSTWHDACEETREMALAYDYVRSALAPDTCRHIEDGILLEAIRQPHKIFSNYPRRDVALAVMHAILGGDDHRAQVDRLTDEIVTNSTGVDGVTGEKGLAGYAAGVVRAMAVYLAQRERIEPGTLAALIRRFPQLAKTYRFHIDTWINQQYYPRVGDTGHFAARDESYAGLTFSHVAKREVGGQAALLDPSMFDFLWRLYVITGDPEYVQVLYHANSGTTDGLPHDLFCPDPAAFEKQVADVIAKHGVKPAVGSINFQGWHLAIMRSGCEDNARAAWLDYDTGERHSHCDSMNLGLFARGLDLIPDLGYPPVQFGGWDSIRSKWYMMTAAHNTVVIDGKNQPRSWDQASPGRATLWGDGRIVHVVRASDPDATGLTGFPEKTADRGAAGPIQFERTIAMIDTSAADSYLVDIFRVVGGTDHAKFQHSHFGTLTTQGLSLAAAADFGHDTQMRNFGIDPHARAGWSAEWKIDDRNRYSLPGEDVRLRYTDLTTDAQAGTCEGWIVAGIFGSLDEAWIPRLMIRRQSDQTPLASTFVAVIEPFAKQSNIRSIRRLPLRTTDGRHYADSHVAVEVELADGQHNLLIAADVENPLQRSPSRARDRVLVQPDWDVELDGELCLIRRDAAGKVAHVSLCQGEQVRIGGIVVKMKPRTAFMEQTYS